MKKIVTGITAAALLLTIGVTGAFAAGPGWGQRHQAACDPAAGIACRYVDADGNGICDNCGRNAGACGGKYLYVDANRDGVCDHYDGGHHGYGHGAHGGCRR